MEWPVSLLEIVVSGGDSGPVVVLAGEADHSSITQLNEVLTAQVSARTSHLTIDVTNLRSADQAPAEALVLAALIVRVQGRSAVLLNPQPLVAQILHRLRAPETFTILGQISADSAPATSTDSD